MEINYSVLAASTYELQYFSLSCFSNSQATGQRFQVFLLTPKHAHMLENFKKR